MSYRAVWADFVDANADSTDINIAAPYPQHYHKQIEGAYVYRKDTNFRSDAAQIDYHQWDLNKIRGCVCDAQYADADCSKRMCPYGTDILEVRDNLLVTGKFQTQKLSFYESYPFHTLNGKTFALTFKSKLNETFTTVPINFDYTVADHQVLESQIRLALMTLPNHVIDDVDVFVDTTPVTNLAVSVTEVLITFRGNAVQGKQFLLTVEAFECQDGCTPKITGLTLDTKITSKHHSNITEVTASDYQSFECGRRGKCDYSTGLCGCFEGYSGDNCNTQTILV